MLNACELASDIERAAHWCKAADEFVATYGCPCLYAQCRIYYGSVLAAQGGWAEAEQELDAGLRITDGSCPGLHGRALIRPAGLRTRRGRLEDAELLLHRADDEAQAEGEQALAVASLLLTRGDGRAAARHLEQRLRGGTAPTSRRHSTCSWTPGWPPVTSAKRGVRNRVEAAVHAARAAK
jgi:hypothetical protein